MLLINTSFMYLMPVEAAQGFPFLYHFCSDSPLVLDENQISYAVRRRSASLTIEEEQECVTSSNTYTGYLSITLRISFHAGTVYMPFPKNEKIRVLFWLCPVKQKNGSCFFPSHPTLYIKQIKASDSCLLKHINDPIYPGSAAAILIRKRMAEIQSKQCLFLHAFLLIFFFLSSYTLAGIL